MVFLCRFHSLKWGLHRTWIVAMFFFKVLFKNLTKAGGGGGSPQQEHVIFVMDNIKK